MRSCRPAPVCARNLVSADENDDARRFVVAQSLGPVVDTSETSLAQSVPAPASKKLGYDLLRLRPVNLLFRWIAFPYIFQAALLVVFVGFALFAWGVHAPTGVPSKIFAKSNLVTLLVWGLWWPSMVWVAVLFGRAWCMIDFRCLDIYSSSI